MGILFLLFSGPLFLLVLEAQIRATWGFSNLSVRACSSSSTALFSLSLVSFPASALHLILENIPFKSTCLSDFHPICYSPLSWSLRMCCLLMLLPLTEFQVFTWSLQTGVWPVLFTKHSFKHVTFCHLNQNGSPLYLFFLGIRVILFCSVPAPVNPQSKMTRQKKTREEKRWELRSIKISIVLWVLGHWEIKWLISGYSGSLKQSKETNPVILNQKPYALATRF